MARGSFYTTEKLGPKRSLTPEGFLLCEEVPIARTGMMLYGPDETPIKAGPDGVVKIYREPEDVFKPETIASAQGKSVANDHPDEDVVPDNWKDLTIGFMLNPRRGVGAMDDLMLADLMITTPEGIKAIQDDNKVEVSLGYDADYEEVSPGVGKQSNIIINHVALVEQGRCGIRCAIGDSNTLGKDATMANKTLNFLMRAFKAKDAAEVEKIAEEATHDDITGGQGAATGEGTHVHVHLPGEETPGEGAGATGEPGRASFSDDQIQEHIDTNAAEHAEMRAEIAALRQMIEAFSAGEAGEEGESMDEAELETNLQEEAPAGMGNEAAKAKDSKYLSESFQDTVAMAEILAPGIKVPTFDAAAKPGQSFKKICGLRRAALDAAYGNPATRMIVSDLVGGKTLDTSKMTCDAIRTMFRSAVAVKRLQNMAPRASTSDASSEKKTGPMTLAELNRLNADRYK